MDTLVKNASTFFQAIPINNIDWGDLFLDLDR